MFYHISWQCILMYHWSASINQLSLKSSANSLERCHLITRNKEYSHDFEHWTLQVTDWYWQRGVIRNVLYKADCWGYKWKSCHISRVNSKFSFPEHALPSCLFPGTSVVKDKKQLGKLLLFMCMPSVLFIDRRALGFQ